MSEIAAKGESKKLTDESTELTLGQRHMSHAHRTDVFTGALTHGVKGSNDSNLNAVETP